jgi:hypothetical protein
MSEGFHANTSRFALRKLKTMCCSRTGGWSLPGVMSD